MNRNTETLKITGLKHSDWFIALYLAEYADRESIIRLVETKTIPKVLRGKVAKLLTIEEQTKHKSGQLRTTVQERINVLVDFHNNLVRIEENWQEYLSGDYRYHGEEASKYKNINDQYISSSNKLSISLDAFRKAYRLFLARIQSWPAK